ncbi:MAG: restriction endonuclease [Alphaproteobacteria bacterium]|jgi:predicted helicase|nr:restriction endonuclease [Alphaproteobacteria bacterium]
MQTFDDILEKYRESAISNRHMGDKFERLMQNYLKTNPVYKHDIEEVYLWNDFPFKMEFGSGKDIGIDLVVQTKNDEYWAVQCKFYSADNKITKADVDSFLATSSKTFNGTRFSKRLWISTTNNWNTESENSLVNQSPEVERIGLNILQNSSINWNELYKFSETNANINMGGGRA